MKHIQYLIFLYSTPSKRKSMGVTKPNKYILLGFWCEVPVTRINATTIYLLFNVTFPRQTCTMSKIAVYMLRISYNIS